MTDLARAFGARAEALAVRKDSAWSSFGNVKPSRPSPPTLSACRREKVVAWNPAQAKECFGGVILALAAFVLQINDGLKPKSIRPFSTGVIKGGSDARLLHFVGARLCSEEQSDEESAAARSNKRARPPCPTCCGWSPTQPRSAHGARLWAKPQSQRIRMEHPA